jgi:hypothetical protein
VQDKMYADANAMALLDIEEADAWFEYLTACRGAKAHSEQRYRDVEPWAWARLQQRRKAVHRRRRKLEP